MKMLSMLAAVLVLTGCATPRHQSNDDRRWQSAWDYSQTGFVFVDSVGPGFQVSSRDVAEARDNGGLWTTYKSFWSQHPWLATASHLGVAAAGYVVGDEAGWWGGRSGGGSSGGHTGDQIGDRVTISQQGEGNTLIFNNRSDLSSGE